MADIDVVPKRRTGVWMWIILAIVVIAICWFLFARLGTTQNGRLGAPAPVMATMTSLPPRR